MKALKGQGSQEFPSITTVLRNPKSSWFSRAQPTHSLFSAPIRARALCKKCCVSSRNLSWTSSLVLYVHHRHRRPLPQRRQDQRRCRPDRRSACLPLDRSQNHAIRTRRLFRQREACDCATADHSFAVSQKKTAPASPTLRASWSPAPITPGGFAPGKGNSPKPCPHPQDSCLRPERHHRIEQHLALPQTRSLSHRARPQTADFKLQRKLISTAPMPSCCTPSKIPKAQSGNKSR